MSKVDDYWEGLKAGFAQGVGDIARGAVTDIGTSYQHILLQDSGIAPPAHLVGDMVTTHDTEPEKPATHAKLQALIDSHAIGQQAETERLEHDLAQQPQPDVGMDR